jgi:hypothetical protein
LPRASKQQGKKIFQHRRPDFTHFRQAEFNSQFRIPFNKALACISKSTHFRPAGQLRSQGEAAFSSSKIAGGHGYMLLPLDTFKPVV